MASFAVGLNEVSVEQAIRSARTVSGKSLSELSDASPVLVVFLRHSGCPFCRETLADLRKQRSKIEARGIRIVIVHQDTPESGARWISKYDLGDTEQISDPSGALYGQFELGKSSWWNLVGPHVWWSGFRATILKLHGVGKIVGDVKQLTGSFLIHRGKLIRSYRQQYSGDRANYSEMVCDIAP